MKTVLIILTIAIAILILMIAAFISTINKRIDKLENHLFIITGVLKEINDINNDIIEHDDKILKIIATHLTFIKQNMIRRKTPIIDD